MRRTLVLVVLAASLVAGACGSGGTSASAGVSYCQALRDTAKKAAPRASGATTSTLSPAGARAAADKTLNDLGNKAPSELKSDYAVLRDFVDAYISVKTNPNADRARFTSLQAQVTTASRHIADYDRRVCKFENTTAPTTTTVKR